MSFTILDLVPDDDPILSEETDKLDFDHLPADFQQTVVDMLETMRHHDAVGLAAPQVGRSLRLFIMETDDTGWRVCANPEVIAVSDDEVRADEGCLSFPDLWLKVKRPVSVVARYQNQHGNLVDETFVNLAARCYLHETDHLNGVRFIEKVGPLALKTARDRRSKHLRKEK